MKTRVMAVLASCLMVGGIGGLRTIAAGRTDPTPDVATTSSRPAADMSRLPVSFVANHGRWDPRTSWVASGPRPAPVAARRCAFCTAEVASAS